MSEIGRVPILSDEQKTKNILETYKFLKKEHHIKTDQIMADKISIPYATLRSFLQNPLSASTAKISICSYFDLSPRDLDEGRLLMRAATDDGGTKSASPPDGEVVPLVQRDPYELLSSTLENGDVYADAEIAELNKRVNRLLNFKFTLSHARQSFSDKNYQIAYISYNSMIIDLDQTNIQVLLKSDIENYFYLCDLLGNTSGLSVFVDKIISDELYHSNVVYVTKEYCLNKEYSELAKKCLTALEQHEAIV